MLRVFEQIFNLPLLPPKQRKPLLKQFPPDLNQMDSQTVSDDGDSCIDLLCRRGLAVPKAYSCDLRERVIEAVAAGASRREAAERFEVSAASAVKCVQRWRDDNSAAAKPRGGSVSPLEEFTTDFGCDC